ncbi:DUF1667 domain-containing protein [Alkalibacter mobilis]|uniref:DUF1667 domain-containing protein n=1 Tax=Alkalibacter mobilis TaxID=2787712 RepID=UPI00189EDA24|nr:DUF1667 domain-containing protein [Alkalibacter mobilis]MBF7096349.1 DUF1667 domain-containing protein [Alkalibacter mobilis]
MAEEKKFTCVVCPIGCTVSIKEEQGKYSVKGNRCKRGEAYAVGELTDPRRVITSTVRVKGGMEPVTSVKTDSGVPKKDIFNVIDAIDKVEISAPCKIGDVIIENICGSGANLVVTRECN